MAGQSVFIGLGANLGDPRANVLRAIEALKEADGITYVRQAPLYRTAPVGPIAQPDFVNTVVEATTDLDPPSLLACTKAIEQQLGRTKTERWGPRVIDLDILILGDLSIDQPGLTIPHPELGRRRFVLAPLADLVPDLVVPLLERQVNELLAELTDDPMGVRVLEGAHD